MNESSHAGAGSTFPRVGNRPRIIIAEDHVDSREALQALLEAYGYEVIVATNGVEVLERARSHAPDLILMDIMMPVLDGLEATSVLRGEPAFDRVPILALTAMQGGEADAMAAGCDDFLEKPLDMRAFFPKIHWWVQNGRGHPE